MDMLFFCNASSFKINSHVEAGSNNIWIYFHAFSIRHSIRTVNNGKDARAGRLTDGTNNLKNLESCSCHSDVYFERQ